MPLDLLRSIQAQPINRFPLDQPISEISSLLAPSLRYILLPDLDLLTKYLVPNILPASAQIGSPAHHTFISNDSYCIVIDSYTMVLLTHDFWSHVPRGTRGVHIVLWFPDPGDPEVSDTYVATVVEH